MKYKNYVFPNWAEYVGWCIALSSILAIPIYAIFLFATQTGSLKEVKIEEKKILMVNLSFFLLISDGSKLQHQQSIEIHQQMTMIMKLNNVCLPNIQQP